MLEDETVRLLSYFKPTVILEIKNIEMIYENHPDGIGTENNVYIIWKKKED